MIAIADEVAAAADLVRGKDQREPAVRVRGLEAHVIAEDGPGVARLIRAREDDLFRDEVGAGQAARLARAARWSKRSRASSTCLPCVIDHAPSAFSGGAIVAPSGVSAYSTRGGTSACTRRPRGRRAPSRAVSG